MNVTIKLKATANVQAWSNREGNVGAVALASMGRQEEGNDESPLVYLVDFRENPHLNVPGNTVIGWIPLLDADIV